MMRFCRAGSQSGRLLLLGKLQARASVNQIVLRRFPSNGSRKVTNVTDLMSLFACTQSYSNAPPQEQILQSSAEGEYSCSRSGRCSQLSTLVSATV